MLILTIPIREMILVRIFALHLSRRPKNRSGMQFNKRVGDFTMKTRLKLDLTKVQLNRTIYLDRTNQLSRASLLRMVKEAVIVMMRI